MKGACENMKKIKIDLNATELHPDGDFHPMLQLWCILTQYSTPFCFGLTENYVKMPKR